MKQAAPPSEPTPPGTSEGERPQTISLSTNGSIRQSPPPLSDGLIPKGAVISPPDSANNSSDDEDEKRGRKLDSNNLVELKEAIQYIEQRREGSPIRQAEDVARANQALALIMPSQMAEVKAAVEHVERQLSPQAPRKISHHRSKTEPVAFMEMMNAEPSESPILGSDEDIDSDDELGRSGRKPPMLRKKSGELVRPALRPSSAKRRPSSMPGTPTFGKAVHFDSHLEHVRHFLQVDRPLAVSAGSSPAESYESEGEFPFADEDNSASRGPPFEWEIVVANFPAETPYRASLPVRVERVFLSADNKNLIGSVAVKNLAFNKVVIARFTLDYWKTTSEVVAEYNNDVRRQQVNDGCDRFSFSIKLADLANLEAKTMFFCVKYLVNGAEFWDNNNATNFQIDFRKKFKPQNGKKGMQGAASRPVNSLPRSNKKSPPAGPRKVMPTNFDDFADGFDSKYNFDFNQPVNDFLGEAPRGVRLKGVKSAVTLPTDNLPRNLPKPQGQAFGNRYDFGASLSAAIQAANSALGDRSGLSQNTLKNSGGKKKPTFAMGDDELDSPPKKFEEARPTAARHSVPDTNTTHPHPGSGSDSPRPAGVAQPVLASQSYNDLLDKYCFVRTR